MLSQLVGWIRGQVPWFMNLGRLRNWIWGKFRKISSRLISPYQPCNQWGSNEFSQQGLPPWGRFPWSNCWIQKLGASLLAHNIFSPTTATVSKLRWRHDRSQIGLTSLLLWISAKANQSFLLGNLNLLGRNFIQTDTLRKIRPEISLQLLPLHRITLQIFSTYLLSNAARRLFFQTKF